MFIVRSKFGGERGDTLVEVLVAIAVVSLVLGGAYVVTNRSLQATRAAQERSIALKLAESQIEQIKGLVSVIPDGSNFCIASDGSVADKNSPANNPACRVNTSGAPTTEEPIFDISVVRTGNNFVLTEEWFNVNGKNIDQLQLRYRAYE